jgi:hypothetical protein
LFVGMVCFDCITSVKASYRRKLDPHPHFCRSLGLVRYVEQTCAGTVLLFLFFRSHCCSHHEYSGSRSNGMATSHTNVSPCLILSPSAHNFPNIPQGDLGGHIIGGTGGRYKFVAFCLTNSTWSTWPVFVLRTLLFTNIAASC